MHRNRSQAGLTLIEIVVVMAIMGLIAVVAVPSLRGLLDLQQRSGAKQLASTYTWLIDEAALRNATFRLAFNLDEGTWKVEVGDANSVVFGTPEEREKYDEELKARLKRYTKRELEEGAADEVKGAMGRFEGLSDPAFTTEQRLPNGTHFGFVWTPEYPDDGVGPSKDALDGKEPDPEAEPNMAYSYIFSDGSAEHTVIRIVSDEDPDEGYTVEVEPLSGRVHLDGDLVDPKQSMAWLPAEGPRLN